MQVLAAMLLRQLGQRVKLLAEELRTALAIQERLTWPGRSRIARLYEFRLGPLRAVVVSKSGSHHRRWASGVEEAAKNNWKC